MLIAISIYLLGLYLPRLLFNKRYKKIKRALSWRYIMSPLAGVLFTLVVSFIIILGLTFTSTKSFVENKNAVYGLHFSETMNDLGFKDHDKIIEVDDKMVSIVSDIIGQIILGPENSNIRINRNGTNITLSLSKDDKLLLLQNPSDRHIYPIIEGDNGPIIITHEKQGIIDAFRTSKALWRNNYKIFIANKETAQIGGFSTIAPLMGTRNFMIALSSSLILMTMIALIPIPGLATGNFVIAIIEVKRKKRFNSKGLIIARICSIIIFIITMSVFML